MFSVLRPAQVKAREATGLPILRQVAVMYVFYLGECYYHVSFLLASRVEVCEIALAVVVCRYQHNNSQSSILTHGHQQGGNYICSSDPQFNRQEQGTGICLSDPRFEPPARWSVCSQGLSERVCFSRGLWEWAFLSAMAMTSSAA